jgi:hypothetical protein
MSDKEITQERSLEIIQGMIAQAQNRISEDGFHFLLWGVLVMLASLSQFFLIQKGYGNDSNIVWMLMPVLGVPIALFYGWKQSKKQQVVNALDRIYTRVWLGFGVTLGSTIFICVSAHMNPVPVILAIVGLATFISGVIYRFNPLIIGAIVFWIGGVVCSFIDTELVLLVNAGCILIGYIIPGVILWKKSKAHV